jgi:hypothetical protein
MLSLAKIISVSGWKNRKLIAEKWYRRMVTIVRDKKVGASLEEEHQSGSHPSTICSPNQNSKLINTREA